MTTRRSASSRWYAEHRRDPFVRDARADGYRSRAAYKLIELDRRDRLLRPGATVVDLGAAPGSWSQVAAAGVGPRGRVVAVDRLEMAPVPGVEIITGDFTDPAVRAELRARLPGGADLVLSDLAPNLTGVRDVDEAAWLDLACLALDLATAVLRRQGVFAVKAFQGSAALEFRDVLGRTLAQVQARKPPASRERSREMYFLARAGV